MSDPKLYGTFVSQKVSKIRFVHEQFNVSTSFITGSWWSSSNSIDLWRLTKDEYSDGDDDHEYLPVSVAKIPVNGDVTGLEFLDKDNVAVATTAEESGYIVMIFAYDQFLLNGRFHCSTLFSFAFAFAGPVLVVSVDRNLLQDNLAIKHKFSNLHKHKTSPAPCTALAVFEGDIASVGEDGT